MENTGLWVTLIIIVFVLGSIFNLRTSPREKALGELRDKARKMGLNPRLVPAPDWLKLEKNGNYAKMIAYYSLIVVEGTFPLMRALVDGQHLNVVHGQEIYQGYPIELKGIYGVEMQANHVSIYWDESVDLKAEQLTAIQQFLTQLSQISAK